MDKTEFGKYRLREVAAVFDDLSSLDAAVEKLTQEGFKDGDFNIMATDRTVRDKLSERLQPVEKLADDPRVPRRAYLPRTTRKLIGSAVTGLPMFALGLGGALGVVATGGAAALALAVAAAGGAVGAGLGAYLAEAMEERHATQLAEAMQSGGIVLWVDTPDRQAEETAIRVLKESGARDVHVHEIERSWGPEDIPLADFNPDPFLEPDPSL